MRWNYYVVLLPLLMFFYLTPFVAKAHNTYTWKQYGLSFTTTNIHDFDSDEEDESWSMSSDNLDIEVEIQEFEDALDRFTEDINYAARVLARDHEDIDEQGFFEAGEVKVFYLSSVDKDDENDYAYRLSKGMFIDLDRKLYFFIEIKTYYEAVDEGLPVLFSLNYNPLKYWLGNRQCAWPQHGIRFTLPKNYPLEISYSMNDEDDLWMDSDNFDLDIEMEANSFDDSEFEDIRGDARLTAQELVKESSEFNEFQPGSNLSGPHHRGFYYYISKPPYDNSVIGILIDDFREIYFTIDISSIEEVQEGISILQSLSYNPPDEGFQFGTNTYGSDHYGFRFNIEGNHKFELTEDHNNGEWGLESKGALGLSIDVEAKHLQFVRPEKITDLRAAAIYEAGADKIVAEGKITTGHYKGYYLLYGSSSDPHACWIIIDDQQQLYYLLHLSNHDDLGQESVLNIIRSFRPAGTSFSTSVPTEPTVQKPKDTPLRTAEQPSSTSIPKPPTSIKPSYRYNSSPRSTPRPAQPPMEQTIGNSASQENDFQQLIQQQRFSELTKKSIDALGADPDNHLYRVYLMLGHLYQRDMEEAKRLWFFFKSKKLQSGERFRDRLQKEIESIQSSGIVKQHVTDFVDQISK